eukprot:Tamp_06464.p1 GENE.Tamp_06464~~Tamp_06464.p1  ORF type:complete len:743 (+),score=212.59 Tamp_06464:41-2230(+)
MPGTTDGNVPSTPTATGRRSILGNEDVTREISVVCRIRPLNAKEIRERSDVCTNVSADGTGVDLVGSERMHFDFDSVIGPDGKQEDVYGASAKPVVDDFLEGFNGTIFCYGQTGSGKTYTMEGEIESPEKRGLLPRMVCSVFDHMEHSGEHMQFMIQIQFLEIYNEKIRDLLSPDKDNLKIREGKTGDIYVEGATSHYITSEDEVQQALEIGGQARATAETFMNQASSRSHSIFILTLEQTNSQDGSKKKSKLFMVDLAGSETVKKTGAEGQTLKEAQAINKSLSALSNVIFALSEGKASHIPYRDSKLTRLLQEALGGNCRTALIINCSPAKMNESETVSTMRFGKSAKRIKNRAHINKEQSPAELKMLLQEMQRQNRELNAQISAKDFEIQALKSVGGDGAEGGAEVAHKIVGLKEEMEKERQGRSALEGRVKQLEAQLQEKESEHEDELDALRNEVDERDKTIASQGSELEEATAKIKDFAEGGGGRGGLSSQAKSGLDTCAQKLQLLKSLASEGGGGAEGAAETLARIREMVGDVTSTLDTALQSQASGAVLGGDVVSQREKELEEQLTTAREEVVSVECKYSKLLEEKIADVDQFTKDRLHKTEELNSTLLKKAKEDSKLLEARELEIQIFEKRLLKNNQRIKILELLLTDTRAKNDQLKASIDGGNLGGGGRTVKGAQRPIQGGSGRRAMHNLAQLQEGVVQDSKDSPVEAVRAFIKRIAGKE